MACKCGGSMKFIQHRSKDIHTLFGWIKVSRAYYHCPDCGKSVFPYDVASGLGSEQVSAGLAKASEYHRHFGRATFIIDWYHASEYIWDCGKKLFGEGTQATEKWVKKRLDWLWDGWTKKLLDDLKEQRKKYGAGKREAIDTLIRYISTNEEQMRYDVFREKGYDIGSGAVEGACKDVVGKRLKQLGMIWTRLGSSSVLALRVSWLNDEWEQLWRKKPLAA